MTPVEELWLRYARSVERKEVSTGTGFAEWLKAEGWRIVKLKGLGGGPSGEDWEGTGGKTEYVIEDEL